jgi:hypothetical protein
MTEIDAYTADLENTVDDCSSINWLCVGGGSLYEVGEFINHALARLPNARMATQPTFHPELNHREFELLVWWADVQKVCPLWEMFTWGFLNGRCSSESEQRESIEYFPLSTRKYFQDVNWENVPLQE